MRWAGPISLLVLLCFTNLARAADGDETPKCAVSCIREAIPRAACAPTDQACLCHDTQFSALVEPCVMASCTVKEALVTQNVTSKACGVPIRDEFSITSTVILSLIVPTLAIGLRLAVKIARVASWGADDTTIVIAYVVTMCTLPLHKYLGDNGAGRDTWTLSFDQIAQYFKGYYIAQCLYHSTMMLIKASILFTFQRVFATDNKFRYVLWATQFINLAVGVIFIFVGIFQCRPINLAWDILNPANKTHCLSIHVIGVTHGSLNIALDVWMLALPITQIWKLNMQRRKRLSAILMFSLGIFLTIVSGIRLKGLLEFSAGSRNPTFDSLKGGVWSNTELGVGVFTASIPNIRQFFIHFILRRSTKPEGSSSVQAQSNNSNLKSPTRSPVETMEDGGRVFVAPQSALPVL